MAEFTLPVGSRSFQAAYNPGRLIIEGVLHNVPPPMWDMVGGWDRIERLGRKIFLNYSQKFVLSVKYNKFDTELSSGLSISVNSRGLTLNFQAFDPKSYIVVRPRKYSKNDVSP